jgi:protein tyrosine phosphatase
MVWEQDVNVLVMLTNVIESTKTKCYKYWPGKSKVKHMGRFTVTLLRKEKEHGLVSRFLQIHRTGPDADSNDVREICHFQVRSMIQNFSKSSFGSKSLLAGFRLVHCLVSFDAIVRSKAIETE